MFFELNINDGNYIITKLPLEVYTARDAYEANPKLNKPFIPKGSKIKIKNIFRNSYGIFCETYYNGIHMTLDPKDISIDKK